MIAKFQINYLKKQKLDLSNFIKDKNIDEAAVAQDLIEVDKNKANVISH